MLVSWNPTSFVSFYVGVPPCRVIGNSSRNLHQPIFSCSIPPPLGPQQLVLFSDAPTSTKLHRNSWRLSVSPSPQADPAVACHMYRPLWPWRLGAHFAWTTVDDRACVQVLACGCLVESCGPPVCSAMLLMRNPHSRNFCARAMQQASSFTMPDNLAFSFINCLCEEINVINFKIVIHI